MSITDTQYKEAFKENIRIPIYKIAWMNDDEIITNETTYDLLDGDINMELISGVRRDCNLSLINLNNDYIPESDGYIWLNKKFKLFTGLQINGENYYTSQGVFNLGNPIIQKDLVSNTIKIEGFDNFSLLNGSIAGELEDDYIIPIGTQITTAVSAIFSIANIPKNPVIHTSTETLPYTIVKEAGGNYGELLKELANILSWVVYFDSDGYPRFEPSVDEQNTASEVTLSNNDIDLTGYTHEYKYYDVKNYIKVYGDNINGDLSTGIAQDNGLFSPTSITRIGKRTKTINDSNIYSDDLAQDRADYELKKMIQVYESGDIKTIPISYLKEGSIITIDSLEGGFDYTRCLVQKINLSLLHNKQQSLTIWKIRDV